MNTRLLLSSLALAVAAASMGGCYPLVKLHRDMLQRELDNSPAALAALKAQKTKVEDEDNAADKELRATRAEERAAQADNARLVRRQGETQAEIDRLTPKLAQLDAEIAAVRAKGPPTPAGSDANGPAKDVAAVAARLIRLEDSLMALQKDLAAGKNTARAERIRLQAWVAAVLQVARCVDMPAMERRAAQEPALKSPLIAVVSARYWRDSLAERLGPWLDSDCTEDLAASSNEMGQVQNACKSAARQVADANVPVGKAMSVQYLALAELYQRLAPVVAALEKDTSISLADRAANLKAMLAVWKASSAAGAAPSGLAAMLRAISLADYINSPNWDARVYIAKRLDVLSRHRAALTALRTGG